MARKISHVSNLYFGKFGSFVYMLIDLFIGSTGFPVLYLQLAMLKLGKSIHPTVHVDNENPINKILKLCLKQQFFKIAS